MLSNALSPLVRFQLSVLIFPALMALAAFLSLGHPANRHFGPYLLLVLLQVPLLAIAIGSVLGQCRAGWSLTAIVGIWLSSFLLAGDEPLLKPLPAAAALHLARVACPVFLIGLVISLKNRGLLAKFAALLASVTVCDYAILSLSLNRPMPVHPPIVFRQPVLFGQISDDDVVVIGDSMTFGAGVAEKEAFPAVMDEKFRTAGFPGTVLNLGVGGAGTSEYIEVLKQIPRKRAAIVCFYMNDMPDRVTSARKWAARLTNMSRASGLSRLGLDILNSRNFGRDVNEYLASLIANFDPSDPSYPERWRTITRRISELRELAAQNARRRPIFVIFPIMWRFSDYPLRQAHAELTRAATSAGFEVIDMLPAFEHEFPDGQEYLAGPNDNHFNAQVHRRVGEIVFERLAVGL
jgi:hypothetical protein